MTTYKIRQKFEGVLLVTLVEIPESAGLTPKEVMMLEDANEAVNLRVRIVPPEGKK